MIRRRYSWLLVLLLILGAGYAATPWAARQLVEIWLLEQGFENPRFTISHPAWDRFEITRISLSKEDDERRLALDAGPIVIRFQPSQLLLNQQLTDIQVPQASLTISYKPAINPQSNTGGELALLPLLPTQLIGLIPADRVLVGELKIQLITPDRPEWHFRGSLDLSRYEMISRVHMRYGLEELGWSDLRFDYRNRFNLQMLYKDDAFLTLEGNIEQQDLLNINFTQQTHITRLREWLSFIEPDIRSWPKVSGKINSHGTLSLPLAFALDDRDWISRVKLDQQLTSALAIEEPTPDINHVVLNSQQQLMLDRGQLEVTLQPDSSVKLETRIPELALPPLNATLSSAFRIQLPLDTPGQTTTDPLELIFRLPPVRHQGMVIRTQPAVLKLDPLQLSGNLVSGTLDMPGIRIHQPGQPLPVLNVQQKFQLEPDQVQSQFRITADETTLNVQGTVNLFPERQLADINWQLQPLGLKHIEHLISRYYPTLPSELSVSAGLLEHRGWGRWQDNQLTLTLRQSARDVRFRWGETAAQQGFWRSELRLQPDGHWRDQGQFKAGLVDVGLPLENLRSFYELRGSNQGLSRARFNNSQLDLLGGQIRAAPFSWKPKQDQFTTVVDIDRIEVRQLLALEQQPGLSGSGIISGHLPVNWQAGQVTITDGELSSQPPGGQIQFTPTESVNAIARSNQGLSMALDALGNFQYDELTIGVTYLADGTALLDTRLKGRNPDWNSGRPVNLGVNVEENLPQLIRTLQITDQLTDSLKKRYR